MTDSQNQCYLIILFLVIEKPCDVSIEKVLIRSVNERRDNYYKLKTISADIAYERLKKFSSQNYHFNYNVNC